MKRILQLLGGIFLAYSVAGIGLHALANLESFGHFCEMLLPAGENHLQVFTVSAAIAAVIFLLAAKTKKKKQLRKRA